MKNLIIVLILLVSFSSCKSSKRVKNKKHSSTKVITKKAKESPENSKTQKASSTNSKADNIINYALTFEGVRYKWGGTTKKGMDCSGLIFESFRVHDIYLPRISRDMAKKGAKLSLKQVKKGDLLFFKTDKNRRNSINHVGLIVAIKNNNIEFIHASSSKGVMTSWLNEKYWLNAFVEARRIL